MSINRQVLTIAPSARLERNLHVAHDLVMNGFAAHMTPDEDNVRSRLNILSAFAAAETKSGPRRIEVAVGSGADVRVEKRTVSRPMGTVREILVQSDVAGDWDSDPRVVAVRDVQAAPADIADGDEIHIKTVLNPVKRTKAHGTTSNGHSRSVVVAMNDMPAWLTAKFARAGVELASEMRLPEGYRATVAKRAGKGFSLYLQPVEASGIVTDADAFREAVRTGLGRSLAYGCGLLRYAVVG